MKTVKRNITERGLKKTPSLKSHWIKRLYKWHNRIGLLAVLPVILWCVSGLSHPFMANWFKPKIAHEFRTPKPLDIPTHALSIRQVLEMNQIEALKTVQLVEIDKTIHYQVRTLADAYRYFNMQDGSELRNGEKIYVEQLARYYLDDYSSPIRNINWQTAFDHQYKTINRLLPVWRIDFDRPDRMTLYVETASGRLATFNPTSRKVFIWIFDQFHNWSFLRMIENDALRIAIMLFFLGTIALSAMSGLLIYGFLWNKMKRHKTESSAAKGRRYHRAIGLAVSFVTITFTFSGGYHALQKLKPEILSTTEYVPGIATKQLLVENTELLAGKPIVNSKIVRSEDQVFYQFFLMNDHGGQDIQYIDAQNGTLWENGDHIYADFLAKEFSKELNRRFGMIDDGLEQKPLEVSDIRSFASGEYGFVFKRLPVVQLRYNGDHNPVYYIETSSSRLAARIDNGDRREGLSFAVLHKFLLMDWAGTMIRDSVTMLSALGMLIVSLLGLSLYLRKLKS